MRFVNRANSALKVSEIYLVTMNVGDRIDVAACSTVQGQKTGAD